MPKDFSQITKENIVKGIYLSYKNSYDLFEVSEILFKNGKLPAACFTAIVSLEELGKVIIFVESYIAGADELGHYKVNVNQLQGIRSHDIKLQKILKQNFFYTNPKEREQYDYRYIHNTFQKLAKAVNGIKKYSLYVSYKNNEILEPAVKINDLSTVVEELRNTLNFMYHECYSIKAIYQALANL